MVDCHGRFAWYELITTDMVAAKAFYAKVVGWSARDASTPDLAYTLFTAGSASVSGLMDLLEDARKMGATPRWTGYVGVDDVDAANAHGYNDRGDHDCYRLAAAFGARLSCRFAETRHRLSGFIHVRQWGDDVLRIFVTGGQGDFGGGGMPQRIMISSRSPPALRSRIVEKHTRHRRQVADVPVQHPEQRDDGGLIRGDAVEIAH